MASSSAQDKNLPASPRKLEKARAEGQVARSRDLGHFAAVAGGGAALVVAAPRSPTGCASRSPARFASTAPRRCATTR
jgi:flagellar biosynthesis protein FlhB